MTAHHRRRLFVCAAALLCAPLMLTACAGGGGGTGSAASAEANDAAVRTAQWRLAQTHEERFEYGRAADLYAQILSEEPTNADAAVAYVRALRYGGDVDTAQEAARVALETIGPLRALRLEQAKAMLAGGRARAAQRLVDDLVAEEPGDWAARSLYALVLDAQGQPEAALAEHRRAHALAPNRAQTINNLALAEAAAGQLTRGIGLLEPAAEDPRAPLHLRMNLALLYMIDNQPDRAEALVRANLPPAAVDQTLDTLRQFRGRPSMAQEGGRLTTTLPAVTR